MTWTRLGDTWADREDVSGVSRSARMLLVEVLIWCNRQETDGRVPARMLRRISDSDDLAGDTNELVEVGLLAAAEGNAYQVDWADLEQEPADAVRARRDAHARRQRAYEERKRLHAEGDHSQCKPVNCSVKGRSTKASPDASVTPSLTPSRPVPSRPDRVRDGTHEAGTVSAGAPTDQLVEVDRVQDVQDDMIVEYLGDDLVAVSLASDYPDGVLQAAATKRAELLEWMGGGYDDVLGAVVVRRDQEVAVLVDLAPAVLMALQAARP